MLQDTITTPAVALFSARGLLRGDLALELVLREIRVAPRNVFAALRERLSGRSDFDNALAAHADVDAAALVFDPQALRHIAEARAAGREVALVPDLPENWSRDIARHLDLPLAGADLARTTWAGMPASSHVEASSPEHAGVAKLARLVLKAIRIYQWPKNALVFLPLLLAHRYSELNLAVLSLLAFVIMGFTASTIYILNDLMDIAADRKHPTKRNRPFASGALPARWGLAIMVVTAASAIALTLFLPPVFALTLGAYLVLNLLYTTYLKRKLLVDVLALAGSYTLRIIAGNAATGIELSFWLLAFSIFLFFSLALVKRFVEMDTIGVTQPLEKRVMGRGYRYADLEMLSQMGVASAFSAVLVLALYVERSASTRLYTHPELIWLICPIVMYVICRIWFLAKRGEMRDDPVAFILHDWRSHLMGVIVTAIMAAASW